MSEDQALLIVPPPPRPRPIAEPHADRIREQGVLCPRGWHNIPRGGNPELAVDGAWKPVPIAKAEAACARMGDTVGRPSLIGL